MVDDEVEPPRQLTEAEYYAMMHKAHEEGHMTGEIPPYEDANTSSAGEKKEPEPSAPGLSDERKADIRKRVTEWVNSHHGPEALMAAKKKLLRRMEFGRSVAPVNTVMGIASFYRMRETDEVYLAVEAALQKILDKESGKTSDDPPRSSRFDHPGSNYR